MKTARSSLTMWAALLATAFANSCSCAEEESPPLMPDIAISGGSSDRAALSSVSATGITIVQAAAAEIRVEPTIDGQPRGPAESITATVDNPGVVRLYKTKDPLLFVITGKTEGNATLILTWKDQAEKRIPVVVVGQ